VLAAKGQNQIRELLSQSVFSLDFFLPQHFSLDKLEIILNRFNPDKYHF
jgi:hypothetical protein